MSVKYCSLEQVAERTWRCRECGRVVAAPAGVEIVVPKPESLPPCGWRPLIVSVAGHVWTELMPKPGSGRAMKCQLCEETHQFPPDATDSIIAETLNRLKPCPKPNPGLFERAARYTKAVSNWLQEGRPTRAPAEVERIFQICMTCEVYDNNAGICRKCGCQVNMSSAAWRNKIAMATESCPLGKW